MPQSYCCLHYHFVFSTKYRVAALAPEMQSRAWEYLGGIVSDLGGTPRAIGGTEDHVHMLVSLRQDVRVCDVMRELKAGSSGWFHKTYPDAEGLWWQDGYGAFTVSHSQLERVSAYIRNQHEHHTRRGSEEEFREMLEKHGYTFSEESLL